MDLPHDQPSATEAADRSGAGLTADLLGLLRGLKPLFSAQFELFAAELGLARGAIKWMLTATLTAMVAGLGLVLTLLALLGMVLAIWLKSWIAALALLALLQLLFLGGAILVFLRGLYWLSLPGTRQEWQRLFRDVGASVRTAGRPNGQPSKSIE